MKQEQETVKTTTNKYDRNNTLVCRGQRIFERDIDLFDNTVFGYRNVQYWDTHTQSWLPVSQDPDKFVIYSDDAEMIVESFFIKWKAYCQRRFGRSFVKLENTNDQTATTKTSFEHPNGDHRTLKS